MLTNESTADIIIRLASEQQLFRFVPRLRGGEQERRCLLLSPRIYQWINANGRNAELRAAVRAHLGRFVKGEQIDDLNYMKRVSNRAAATVDDFSDGVWSIRPLFEPKQRFFGAFPLPDHFIIFAMQSRRALNTDPQWNNQIRKVTRTWNAMFPGRRCFSGSAFAHYVTFNADHKDGRWTERN
jgi:hypothetical protein